MSDEQAIRQTIQVYFDSMFEADPAKVHAAFHEAAKITGYTPGGLAQMTVAEFAGFVGAQPSAKAAGATPYLDVLSIQIAGQTAVALVRDDYIGNRYLDTLSMLKCDEQWLIYNKLFHIEGAAG